MSEVLSARGRYGRAVKVGDPSLIQSAARDLAAAKLEQYAERIVSEAPQLSAEQVDRVITILRGSSEQRTLRRPVEVDRALHAAPDHIALADATAGGDTQ